MHEVCSLREFEVQEWAVLQGKYSEAAKPLFQLQYLRVSLRSTNAWTGQNRGNGEKDDIERHANNRIHKHNRTP